MSRKVIICEKPSVAKTVANAIGANVRKDGYYQSADGSTVVTNLVGHVMEMPTPDEINPDYKKWSLQPLPFKFDTDKLLRPKAETKKVFDTVKKLIEDKDTTLTILFPDIDVEGVTLQAEFINYLNYNKIVKVAWCNDMTDASINKAINNLIDFDEIAGKYERGKARIYLDYHIGMNYTRGATLTFGNGNKITFGRCMTPLLNILVTRDEEIKNFKVEDYYEVKTTFDKGFSASLVEDGKTVKFKSEADAKTVANSIKGKTGKVDECKVENKKKTADKLFSLQSLQSYAGGKYGFSPDKTLEICQKLYEKALLTYPRTDSEYISTNMWKESKDYLDAIAKIDEYKPFIDKCNFNPAVTDKKYVNDGKITAHTAITPTAGKLADGYKDLTDDEKKIFDTVTRRFIAIYMDAYKFKRTTLSVSAEDKKFVVTGNVPLDLGWKTLYKDEPSEEEKLPKLNEGDKVVVGESKIEAKKTTPPVRYGASNIIDVMKAYNIGTPATQAGYIPKLVKNGYIKETKGKYFATDAGRNYIDSIKSIDELANPKYAQSFEDKLQAIENGDLSLADFKQDFDTTQADMIEKFKSIEKISRKRNIIGKCPVCGKDVFEAKKSFSCTGYNDGCKFAIWKDFRGKEITEKIAKELLETGKTKSKIKFKKKDGEGTYEGFIVLTEDHKMNVSFK